MSVDKLLARSTPLSVNSCPIQELTDIPGVGWDIARSLMGIREEGQITLPVLEAVTRRVFHQDYLEKLDFAPAGLTSAIRGSARPKTPSERRTDQWAEDLKSEHPGTSGLPDTPHMPRRLPTPGPDFQKIEDELNAMLGEITMRGGAKKKTSKEPKGKLSFSADPDEDLQRRMDRLRPPRVKQEKVRVPQLAHDRHQPDSSSEEEDVDTGRPLYRPSLYTRSEVSALKSLPKTLIYDGKGNWQAFQLKFGRFAGASAWTEQQCRDCLLHCLTDKALSYAAMILRRDPDLSYRKMMRKLEQRFGAEELPAAVQAKFSQAMQSKGEIVSRTHAFSVHLPGILDDRRGFSQEITRSRMNLLIHCASRIVGCLDVSILARYICNLGMVTQACAEISKPTKRALDSLCKEMGSQIQEEYQVETMNSPALLMHWRVFLVVLGC